MRVRSTGLFMQVISAKRRHSAIARVVALGGLALSTCPCAVAGPKLCSVDRPIDTPIGQLVTQACGDDKNNYVYSVLVGSRVVLQDTYLSWQDDNKDRSIWIFRGQADVETGCARRIYLVDLSVQPIRVIAFGVKTACTEFHWASWGKSRSVIALKKNVKFIYENGKLSPPRTGQRLFESVEPPHSIVGGGMTEESAVPFVESVALPR